PRGEGRAAPGAGGLRADGAGGERRVPGRHGLLPSRAHPRLDGEEAGGGPGLRRAHRRQSGHPRRTPRAGSAVGARGRGVQGHRGPEAGRRMRRGALLTAETTLVDRPSLGLAADPVVARRLRDTGPAPSSLLGLGRNSSAIIRPTSLVSVVTLALAALGGCR